MGRLQERIQNALRGGKATGEIDDAGGAFLEGDERLFVAVEEVTGPAPEIRLVADKRNGAAVEVMRLDPRKQLRRRSARGEQIELDELGLLVVCFVDDLGGLHGAPERTGGERVDLWRDARQAFRSFAHQPAPFSRAWTIGVIFARFGEGCGILRFSVTNQDESHPMPRCSASRWRRERRQTRAASRLPLRRRGACGAWPA